MNININKTLIIYALIAGMVVLIIVPLSRLYTKIYPAISTTVAMPAKEAGDAPALNYTIPVNPLPTDDEIEESVKAQNEQQEVVKQAIADRMKEIAAISEKIRMNQNEPPPTTDEGAPKTITQLKNPVSSVTKVTQMLKELLQDVQSRRYLLR